MTSADVLRASPEFDYVGGIMVHEIGDLEHRTGLLLEDLGSVVIRLARTARQTVSIARVLHHY